MYLYDFLAFSTRTHVVKDLPFGRWYLQLSSAEFRLTPDVISIMIPLRTIVLQYCEKTNFTADATKAFDDLAIELQRPEEYCLENSSCSLWDLVLTDQAGS